MAQRAQLVDLVAEQAVGDVGVLARLRAQLDVAAVTRPDWHAGVVVGIAGGQGRRQQQQKGYCTVNVQVTFGSLVVQLIDTLTEFNNGGLGGAVVARVNTFETWFV